MEMISYAQNGEDVVLNRVFGGRHDGFYVDVGAAHPITDSVTKHFYDLGWSGVNIEPLSREYQALAELRSRDTNLNVAVGSGRETRRFFEAIDAPGLSTFTPALAEHARTISEVVERDLDLLPLADIFDEHVGNLEVDFLKVDVEGLEQEVLAGHDWTRYRPRVIVIEGDVAAVKPTLDDAGYRQTLWDGINSFWVRSEDAAALGNALSYPAVMVLDGFKPWHLHYFARDAVQRILSHELKGIDAALLEALADVYCRCPDLQAAYGGPLHVRGAELVRWAVAALGGDGQEGPNDHALRRLAEAELPQPRSAARRLVGRAVRRVIRSF
jgi:FkbM family methyltransferase